jgi:hypothetical protein
VGTLFDKEEKIFNLDQLDTRLSRDWAKNARMRNERVFNVKKRNRKSKSDGSLNQEKTENWRIGSPLFGTKYFAVLNKNIPKGRKVCKQYATHKNILLCDEELTRNNVPYLKVTH